MTALVDFYRTRMRMAILEQLQYPVVNDFYMIGMMARGRTRISLIGIDTCCHVATMATWRF